MQTRIEGAPSFAYLHVDLDPGESLTAEAGAMASMDPALTVRTVFNGGLVGGLLRRFFGGESLFVNVFENRANKPLRLTLVQSVPGDLKEISLANQGGLCLQPGAYLASTPGIRLRLKWAGFASFFAREGLFKLLVEGQGQVWLGAYGGILFREVREPLIVDSSHLVAYEPGIRLKLRLAGGIFSSFFGGEGLVMRVEGPGKIAIQTRSLEALASYVNPMLS